MSYITRSFMLVFALFSVLIIAGCEVTKTVPATCPRVVPLEDAAYLTRFLQGPGRDITDITIEAEFSRIAGDCIVDDEDIEVGILIELLATKGPALEGATQDASLLFFVMTSDKKLIKRKELPIVFGFPGNQDTIRYSERFLIDIPKIETQDGDDFLVYLAFQLSREELRFNREERNF